MKQPETLDQIIGQGAVGRLQRYASEAERGSKCFLLHGPPGCGKSASAMALCNELGVTKNEPLLIEECASDLTIDRLDELFRRTFLLSYRWKVLLIEEMDGMTSAQAARAMKVYLDPHRMPKRLTVIATSNHPENLPAAILDRFTRLEYRGDQSFAQVGRQHLLKMWREKAGERSLPSDWVKWGACGESFSLRSAMISLEDAL